VRVVVAAIRLTTTSWLARVWPRQFDEMWENSRCSIWGEMHPPDPDFGYTRYCERCVFWGSQSTPTTGMLLSAQNRASFGDAERTRIIAKEPPVAFHLDSGNCTGDLTILGEVN